MNKDAVILSFYILKETNTKIDNILKNIDSLKSSLRLLSMNAVIESVKSDNPVIKQISLEFKENEKELSKLLKVIKEEMINIQNVANILDS
jgi:CxxC motif-containing protein